MSSSNYTVTFAVVIFVLVVIEVVLPVPLSRPTGWAPAIPSVTLPPTGCPVPCPGIADIWCPPIGCPYSPVVEYVVVPVPALRLPYPLLFLLRCHLLLHRIMCRHPLRLVALVFSMPDLAEAPTLAAVSFIVSAAFFADCIFHSFELIFQFLLD
ncbi:18 kDa seed maturation protein [Senna tora]|uniref:18 kDa seed maturation protein n=1 Tax=Senna tora TaxID=362788 RepID=A0A834W0G6_9FABA|nr:18 kDa seed maturation protein [Senna tora]